MFYIFDANKSSISMSIKGDDIPVTASARDCCQKGKCQSTKKYNKC